jgi:hypothetical protein
MGRVEPETGTLSLCRPAVKLKTTDMMVTTLVMKNPTHAMRGCTSRNQPNTMRTVPKIHNDQYRLTTFNWGRPRLCLLITLPLKASSTFSQRLLTPVYSIPCAGFDDLWGNSIRPQPGLIRPRPDLIRPQPGLIRPRPDLIRPQPGLIRPQPDLIRPQPDLIRPQPDLIRPQPDLIRPQPDLIRPQPDLIRPQPG